MSDPKTKSYYLGRITHFNKEKKVKALSISYSPATPRVVGDRTYVDSGGVFFNMSGFEGEFVSIHLGIAEVADLVTRLQKAIEMNLNKEIKIANQ